MKKFIKLYKNIPIPLLKIFFLILTCSLLFSCKAEKKNIPRINPPFFYQNQQLIKNDFIQEFILKNGIVYSNYFFSSSNLTTNNIVLSESQGLIMEYAIYTRNKELFDKSYFYLKRHMKLKNGLFSWEYNDSTKTLSSSSATIDDLRIFKSLIYAHTLWGGYEEDIFNLEKGLSNTLKKEYLTDFWEKNEISNNVSIRYIDIVALNMLTQMDKNYNKTLNKSIKLLENSVVNHKNLFSYDLYRIDTKEYVKNNTTDALNSLITIYNKSLAGINIDNEFLFLKSIFYRDSGIYSKYDLNGFPITTVKSTAIYSYLKLIAINKNDKKFLEDINKERELLLNNNLLPVSQLGRKLYSFDLLTLLLSSLEGEKNEQGN